MNLDPCTEGFVEPPIWYWDSETLSVNYMESEYHLGYPQLFEKKQYAIWVNKCTDNEDYIFYVISVDPETSLLQKIEIKRNTEKDLILNDVCSRRLSFLQGDHYRL